MEPSFAISPQRAAKEKMPPPKKLRLRDCLFSMFSEFVCSTKSPEIRLSSASQQFLLEAVREEKRQSMEFQVRFLLILPS